MPKGTSATNIENTLCDQVRNLLAKSEKDPQVHRVERTSDHEVVALLSVSGAFHREARTAWITYDGDRGAEVVVCSGFVW